MKPLSVAIEAALAGGAILRSYFGGDFRTSYKGEMNLVTQADTESEQEVISILQRRLPDVSILAEESGAQDADVRRRFIIDPLDGTTNFAHAYAMFAVSIGYEEDGRVVAGVVYDPVREELFTAEHGQGAFLNGRRIAVSRTETLDKALLVTGFPYDLKDDLEGNLRSFNKFMGSSRAIRRDGSAALDLCYLAAGRFGRVLGTEARAVGHGRGGTLRPRGGRQGHGLRGWHLPLLPEADRRFQSQPSRRDAAHPRVTLCPPEGTILGLGRLLHHCLGAPPQGSSFGSRLRLALRSG